ncbi:MAG: carboxypeptidase regulatory-like domain-containing protein [Sphingomonadales bacterium]|nr:carboxypeptidase regulatory-like domain-containing protein [Sphingomonadales bacterium]
MQLRYFLAASVASLTLATAIATPAFAQETTSAVTGQVTDESGAPVAGAKVVVTHQPSGTRNSVLTDGTGNYSLRGLRVGGPYTVTVTSPAFAAQTIEGITLSVGEAFGVPVQLAQREIIVSADRVAARGLATSSQSTFRASDIQDIVSARRDVRDIVRRDPLAAYNPNVGGVTIAGGNIRTQRFSVDGVQMQDSFGLNYGGLPSTRGIVSIEAIDQLTVKAAPFDISEGNFQGGAVNVVMKSGNNAFHVTAFGNFGGPSLTGDQTRNNHGALGEVYPVGKTTVFNFTNWGGSISGPIIKDKLFFSAAYEKLTEGAPNTYGIAGSTAANIVPGLTQAQVDDVIARFNSAGYDKYNIGTIPTAIAEKDKKYSAKLDWNVTDGQRFTLSYIHHENTLPNFATGAATGSSSTTTPYIQLQSNQYQLTEFTNAISGQLNSQWSSNLSSEVRVAYKYYRRGQDPYFGTDFAQMAVCTDATSAAFYTSTAATQCNTGNGIVRLGPDTPRQANKFDNRQLTIATNLQLKAGDHTFKLEADHFHTSLYNLFVYGGTSVSSGGTGGGSGAYYFDSLADFTARTPNEFVLTTTSTGNKNDGYVDWAYDVNTVGLQDTWKPSSRLTVNGGLRFDMYAADKSIATNQNFLNRYSALYPGLTNAATLNGRAKLQPRFGFNWAATDTLRVSGGAGLFAGGLSDVFISNNYSNSGAPINATGATIASIDILRTGVVNGVPTCVDRANGGVALSAALCTAALTNVAGGTIPSAIINYVKSNSGVSANALTNSLDPNFKLPAQWKYNLHADWKPEFGDSLLARGWSFRADMLYSKAQQAVRWIDLRSQPLVSGGVVQVAPDGRPRYGGAIGSLTNIGGNYDIQLTNTTKGRALVWALGVTKDLGDIDMSATYTHQNVKDVAGILTSSTVSSAFSIPTSDPNSGGDYGRSTFEVTHTLRANLSFKHKFFGDNYTRFGINWELRSGQPWSVTMFDNTTNVANGRSAVFGTALNTSSHLFYVPDFSLAPTNNGLTYGIVTFADAATRDSVMALVKGTKLADYQGKISPKNVLTGPRYNKVDLNFAQQIPFVFGSKITALLSIENFLNLLNKNWGTYQDFGGSQSVVRVACNGAAVNGQTCPGYTYSVYSAPKTQSYSKPSLYAIRAGVRLDF